MHLGKSTAALLLALTVNVMAQPTPTTAPSDAPASMPATEPVVADSTTPKGTLLLLSRATAAGDVTTVLSLLSVSNAEDQKLADALMRRNIINVKFRAALAKAFSEDVATQMAGDASEDETRIASATADIQGSEATIRMSEAEPPINLVKADGVWKLSLKGLTGNLTPQQVEGQLSKMKMVVDAIDATTSEIGTGKFKKPEEVELALRDRLMAASTPTTVPSSMPAAQP